MIWMQVARRCLLERKLKKLVKFRPFILLRKVVWLELNKINLVKRNACLIYNKVTRNQEARVVARHLQLQIQKMRTQISSYPWSSQLVAFLSIKSVRNSHNMKGKIWRNTSTIRVFKINKSTWHRTPILRSRRRWHSSKSLNRNLELKRLFRMLKSSISERKGRYKCRQKTKNKNQQAKTKDQNKNQNQNQNKQTKTNRLGLS